MLYCMWRPPLQQLYWTAWLHAPRSKGCRRGASRPASRASATGSPTLCWLWRQRLRNCAGSRTGAQYATPLCTALVHHCQHHHLYVLSESTAFKPIALQALVLVYNKLLGLVDLADQEIGNGRVRSLLASFASISSMCAMQRPKGALLHTRLPCNTYLAGLVCYV
jgi:glucose-6-phosphate-specific signal transduction histidine kinase